MDKIQETLENQSNMQSIDSGLRVMDPVQVQGAPVFPWAPTTNLQKVGASMVKDKSLVDIDSELMNLSRKLSNDPNQHYKPEEIKPVVYDHLQDGFFHSEDTRLTNPASVYRGLSTNRWIELHKGAQVNVIEPFDYREGHNTHIMLVDTYEPCIDDALKSIGESTDT